MVNIEIPEPTNRRDVQTAWGLFRVMTGDKVAVEELNDMIVWLTIKAEKDQVPAVVWYHGHRWEIARVVKGMVERA